MSTGTDYDLWIRAVIARDDDDDDPSPPKPPKKSPSPTISSSTALPTATQIEGLPIQTLTIVRPPKGGGHLGPGETAGIGIGVALAVLGIALGIWFCVRRRRRKDAAGVLPGTTLRDMEAGEKGMESHSMEFTGVPEMETGTVGARRFSELAGRRSPAEMVSEPHTVVELEGSNVMARYLEKKNRERLFLDPPIDEKEDDSPEDDSPKVDQKKDQW